jgi:hypothetical protein
MTYSQIFKSSDLPYFVKFAHFTNFASRFIKSVRNTFGAEIDLTTDGFFSRFVVVLHCDDYFFDVAQISVFTLKVSFCNSSFLMVGANSYKFEQIFLNYSIARLSNANNISP